MARRTSRSSSRRGGNKVKVDFTGVETSVRFDDDDYALKLIGGKKDKSEAGNDMIVWDMEVTRGKFAGKRPMPYYTSLASQALWNLRGLLESIGVEVPDGVLEIDIDEIIADASEFGGTIEKDDSYDGKARSKVVDVFPLEDLDLDGDSGEKAKPSEDDVSDDLEPDDIEEMDLDELEDVVDEYDLDVDLDAIKGRGKAKLEKQRAAVMEAYKSRDDEDDDDDDDDDDDEGEAPTEDEVKSMGTKELTELAEDYEFELPSGTLRKKRTAMVKFLKEEGEID